VSLNNDYLLQIIIRQRRQDLESEAASNRLANMFKAVGSRGGFGYTNVSRSSGGFRRDHTNPKKRQFPDPAQSSVAASAWETPTPQPSIRR